jgi:hypothetical protein
VQNPQSIYNHSSKLMQYQLFNMGYIMSNTILINKTSKSFHYLLSSLGQTTISSDRTSNNVPSTNKNATNTFSDTLPPIGWKSYRSYQEEKNLVSFRGPTRKLICLQKKCGIHMVLRDSFELLANKNSTKLKMCYGITQGKTNNTFIMRRHPIGPVTVRIP